MELAAAPRHSRLTIYLVLLAAVIIIGAWTFFTQAGLQGKADAVGYAICHRIASRSFEAFGRPLPLCARCTGIYLGVMTGLGVFFASGRGRCGQLPDWRVSAVLGAFVVIMGIDGLNSYFTLYPSYEGIYQPHNWLRLTTGVFCGLTLISFVFPIFNQSIWHNMGDPTPPLRNLKELAGMCLLAGLVILLTLAQNATVLLFLGLVSAAGVLIVLTMMFMVVFVTVTQNFRTYHTWQELWLAGIAGLTMAFTMIGAIDFARYTLTGTWNGFTF